VSHVPVPPAEKTIEGDMIGRQLGPLRHDLFLAALQAEVRPVSQPPTPGFRAAIG
jgi:hypothetical protein